MITEIVGVLIGAAVLITGVLYRIRATDQESRKIYTIAGAAGAAIILISIVMILLAG